MTALIVKPPKARKLTREEWLERAVDMIRPDMKAKGVKSPKVKVSCSWPGGGDSKKRIGECWATQASKAGINEIFISPKIEDSAKVIAILMHELAHAVDNCVNKHNAAFVAIASTMGLQGKPTQMMPPVPVAKAWATTMRAAYGRFPHRVLDKSLSPVKKQTTRMLKVECGDCTAVWRMSSKHVLNVTHCCCCDSENLTVES
jgi:hypothetical protein